MSRRIVRYWCGAVTSLHQLEEINYNGLIIPQTHIYAYTIPLGPMTIAREL